MLTVSPAVGHHSSTGVCLGGTPGSGGVSIGALVVFYTLQNVTLVTGYILEENNDKTVRKFLRQMAKVASSKIRH